MPLIGICALDLATTTGYAVEVHGAAPLLGMQHFPRFTVQKFGPQGLDFMNWLRIFLLGHRPERVVFEKPHVPQRQSSTAVATIAIGFAALTEVVCAEQRIPVSCVIASTCRKFFTGSGKNDRLAKGRVIEECQRRGWDPPDDNAADAACILAWAVNEYHPTDALRRANLDNPKMLLP